MHQVYAPGICTRYMHQVYAPGICTRYMDRAGSPLNRTGCVFVVGETFLFVCSRSRPGSQIGDTLFYSMLPCYLKTRDPALKIIRHTEGVEPMTFACGGNQSEHHPRPRPAEVSCVNRGICSIEKSNRTVNKISFRTRNEFIRICFGQNTSPKSLFRFRSNTCCILKSLPRSASAFISYTDAHNCEA
jgi:hypothetical protein